MGIIKEYMNAWKKEVRHSYGSVAQHLTHKRQQQLATGYTLVAWISIVSWIAVEPERFRNILQLSCDTNCERQVGVPTVLIMSSIMALIYLSKRHYKRVLKYALAPFVAYLFVHFLIF